MKGNDCLGIIFSNTHDELLRELTWLRATGSMPFGGRYRLIDFSLSNLVNAGVSRVGVITKSNYQSLMDHLGSGKPWNLARKKDGLFILPPYGRDSAVLYTGKIQGLTGIMGFLDHSIQKTVIMCDADVISNLDLEKVLDAHEANQADITVVYRHCESEMKGMDDIVNMTMDETGRVREIKITSAASKEGNYALDIVVISKALLVELITDAAARNLKDFCRDILQRNVVSLKIYGFKAEGYTAVIDSMSSYLNANMDLLRSDVRRSLFPNNRPVYTKSRDDCPAKYGLSADVKNSLIADGCQIEGQVENSILFRGVKIGKGSVVKNSIILQDSIVEDVSSLAWVITDKDVTVGSGRTLNGSDSYPVFIAKGAII